MDPMTREALEASIKHWEENVSAKTVRAASTGARECALCQLFLEGSCKRCPVFERTGQPACRETPYDAASKAYVKWCLGNGTRRAFRAAAQAELDFLRSLLP